MSLLGSIISKVLHPFGGSSDAQAAPAPSETHAQPGSPPPASTSTSSGGSAAAPAPAGGAASGPVDVEKVLTEMAAKRGQKLNWRVSIVDLMTLLDLDSSLTARRQLADELHYTGDKNDTATMNIWLHKQVVKKLAENGGKVPDDLKD